MKYREIHINNRQKNRALYGNRTNKVYTSKYTPLTLFPLFMLSQLSRFQILFFLITGIIQLTYPQVPGSRWGIIVPLAGIVFIALIKEIISERKLWKNDKIANTAPVEYVSNGALLTKPCGDVEIGDILKVNSGEIFPADMIILSSSDAEGKCYIETSNMDGEMNLKIRTPHKETMDLNTPERLKHLRGEILADLPSKSLTTFHGKLFAGSAVGDDIGLSQTLLRGARLVKTNCIFGLVIYNGHETKLLLNNTKPTIKRTNMDNTLNVQMLALFFYLYILSLICAYESAKFTTTNPFAKNILYEDGEFVYTLFYNLPIFILLYNNIVPVSLVITCEMLKVILGRYVDNDQDMYYPPAKGFAFSRSDWLMDDLGLVDNIFCDKTGTLTCNQIKFRAIYSENSLFSDCQKISKYGTTIALRDMIDIKMFSNVEGGRSLAAAVVLLCNEATPMQSDEDPSKLEYITPSADEDALLSATSSFGLQFSAKYRDTAVISHLETQIKTNFEILAVNKFSSFRRRMSVIVRTPNKKIHLYVKGSDESVFSRMSEQTKTSKFYVDTRRELKSFMSRGYRVLCLAYKELSLGEFDSWMKSHKQFETADPDSLSVQGSYTNIESNLLLLGFTLSEDRLQDFVPETISTLSKAGIKTWILTGDGRETAINIAKSCKFINHDMPLLECLESREGSIIPTLNKLVNEFYRLYPSQSTERSFGAKLLKKISRSWKIISNSILRFFSRTFNKFLMLIRYKKKETVLKQHLLYRYGRKKFPEQRYAGLVVTGPALEAILDNDEASRIFLSLSMECSSVVCSSMSPSQKSQVVSLVKNNVSNAVTLAVGDGANDVGMIRAAHIGVGINGLEGTQASRNSDFTIYQFHHLSKLIIGHGSRSYYSISSFVLYSFYKNILLYTSQIWYQIYGGFSSQTLYETWSSISSYNLLWMFTQPFVVGVYGRSVTTDTIMRYPMLYKLGHKREFYNQFKFYRMIVNSLTTSYMAFYIWRCIYYFGHSNITSYGKPINCWFMGEMIFTTILATISIESILYILQMTLTTTLLSLGPVALFMCCFILYSKYAPKYTRLSKQLYGLSGIFSIYTFWLGFVLFVGMRLYVDVLHK